MKIEFDDQMNVKVNGKTKGFAADAIVNNLADVDPDGPADSLSHQVARAMANHCREVVSECRQKMAEAEETTEEAEQYIPHDEDEIERKAKARAVEIQNERAIEARARELADAE